MRPWTPPGYDQGRIWSPGIPPPPRVWRPSIYDLPEIDRSRIYVPQEAAISRITGQDAKGAAAAASVTATYPGATTAGNLLVASLYANVGLGLESMTGWTKAKDAAINIGASVGLWYRLADGTETTVTGAATGAGVMRIHIYEYTGNANPIVVDQVNGADNGGGSVTTVNSTAITTTNANDLLFAVFGVAPGAITSPSVDSSFNLRQADSTIRMFDADQIVAATGTYSTNGSWTTARTAGSLIVSFQAVASGVPTYPQLERFGHRGAFRGMLH